MKRISNIYYKIYSLENLILAENKARKGKTKYKDVVKFDLNKRENLIKLQKQLINKSFKNSKYHIFTIFEGKERVIYKLPYYPDRIVHHAIMNILEPIFINCFTSDTYSCIKKRGIHKALINLNYSLKDKNDTKYCLKLDVKKFYPSIDHNILKFLLRKKFKDKDLLNLLYEIINSADGLPIGNYLSQFFGNFYLTYLDHWIKEELKVKYYFRYCDDMVILSSNKKELDYIRKRIQEYLKTILNLELKSNYQIFPIKSRGIDFLGYKSYHTHVLLRKSIKLRWINMLNKYPNKKSKASYNGWLYYANTINLQNKYLNGNNKNKKNRV
jgi:RNA-directed DNA polymerase